MDDVILSPTTAQRSRVEDGVKIEEKAIQDLRSRVEQEEMMEQSLAHAGCDSRGR